jgi:hypothetical protein
VVISPPEGAIVPPGVFALAWVSVGVLQAGEVYLVQLTDTVTGTTFNEITRNTSLLLPASLVPTDGQSHLVNWTVAVARPNADGVYQVISGSPQLRTFNWQSR